MSAKSLGFGLNEETVDTSKARAELERTFTPEFRNRLDATVLFQGLPKEVILQVVRKEVALLQKLLADKNVTVELSTEAEAWFAEHGYDAKMGARPMARLIEREIKKPLAEALLFGSLTQGGKAFVDVANGKPLLRFEARA